MGRRPSVLCGMEKAPCKRTFQYRSASGGLRNPQTSTQLFGIVPGPHNGVGHGGVGNAQSAKASSTVLMLPLLLHRHAVSLKITCNQVNLLTNHGGTDCEDELFRNTPTRPAWTKCCSSQQSPDKARLRHRHAVPLKASATKSTS